jgi:signal transduction histidine kinase
VREAVEREQAAVVSGQPARSPAGLEDAVRLPTPEGEVFLLPRASRVLGEAGDLRAVTITVQDVTRARRFDELKNDLVATVAHEFRTPLTSLRMAVHLCLERAAGPVTEKQLDLLHAARQDTERLQQLVDDLLDLSRFQSGQVVLHPSSLVVEDLVEATLAAWQATAREKSIALKAEVLPGTDTVWADAERLGLVLGNLIGNAVKHSPVGSPVVVRAWRTGPTVRMEVIDRGPGIPAEFRALVFEKFFQVPGGSSAGGAGLGLFLAKEITQAHGGRIGVEGGPEGMGSVFWLEWPAEPGTTSQGPSTV